MNRLTALLMAHAALCILFALLLHAVWTETRKQPIVGSLMYVGCVLGVALNTLLPAGLGFVSQQPGAIGFWKALIGMLLGFSLLLPLFWVGMMDSDETRLMAVVGAFLGPAAVIGVAILSYIGGTFLFLIFFLRGQSAKRMLENVQTKVLAGLIQASTYESSTLGKPTTSTTRKPYAIAIALGCFVYFAFSGFEQSEYLYLFNLF